MTAGYMLVIGTLAAGLRQQRRGRTTFPARRVKPGTAAPGGRAWLRLVRHMVATFAGGYLLLMAVVVVLLLRGPGQRKLPGKRRHRLRLGARLERTAVPGRVLARREAGPPPRKNGSALDLGEADVQAETAQHPDEPEGGQEGPRDDAAYGDGGGEQFNYLC
jgi:hypothetical protein